MQANNYGDLYRPAFSTQFFYPAFFDRVNTATRASLRKSLRRPSPERLGLSHPRKRLPAPRETHLLHIYLGGMWVCIESSRAPVQQYAIFDSAYNCTANNRQQYEQDRRAKIKGRGKSYTFFFIYRERMQDCEKNLLKKEKKEIYHNNNKKQRRPKPPFLSQRERERDPRIPCHAAQQTHYKRLCVCPLPRVDHAAATAGLHSARTHKHTARRKLYISTMI